jgi:glycosyltransferase involved in cell wall biosynthesis
LVNWTLARGGAEKQCAMAAVELAKAGHAVTVFTLRKPNDYADLLAAGDVPVEYVDVGGPLRRLTTTRLRGPLAGNFDVIHAFDIACLTDVLRAVPTGRKVVAGCRAGLRLSAVRQALIRRAVRRRPPDGWIVNAPAVRDVAVDRYGAIPEKVAVVRNAIYLSPFARLASPAEARRRLDLPADLPVVALIANYRPMKNHEMFFRLAETIIRRGRAVTFVLAGHGPRRKEVDALRRKHRLEASVRMLGLVENVPTLLAATDIVVLTSHAGTEGVPNVLLEAAAAERPAVATCRGAETVIEDGRTGLLVPPDDHEAMADRIEDLLDQPDLRCRLAAAAKQHVRETFAAEHLAERLVAAYSRAEGR